MTVSLIVAVWLAAGLLAWGYVGFPLLMAVLARIRPRPVKTDDAFRPPVTLLIAACNEERTIRQKLINSLQLEYPRELLEIVVVADGSTDATASIVAEYAGHGVRLLHQPERRGKSAALDRALRECRGEIVLFSDANTDYAAGSVAALVRHFADPTVGGVSGRKIVVQDQERAATDGETAYWSYEAALKTWESATGSITTADGEIFAVRRALVDGIPKHVVHDDMYLTLALVQRGYRVLYEPLATSSERASKSLRDEFHLKLRYASAGYQILRLYRGMFFPVPSRFGWRFISHKVLRWIAPFLLIAVLAASAMLATVSQWYLALFAVQALFYGFAALGLLLQHWTRATFLYFPLYFSVMNAAAFCGFVKYFVYGQSPLWRKAER